MALAMASIGASSLISTSFTLYEPSQEACVCDYQSLNQAIDPQSLSRFSTALPGYHVHEDSRYLMRELDFGAQLED